MAGVETSVFEIAVGETGRSGPHILLDVDLNIGGSSGSDGRAQLNALLGADPDEICPYAVIHAASSQHAAELAQGLNAAVAAARSAPPDPTQNALAFILANAQTEGGSFEPVITHHGENVILKLNLPPTILEMLQGMAAMVRAQAGPLLESKNSLEFSVDIGNTFESILNSNNLVLDLFSSLDIKFQINLQANTGDTVNQLVSALGLPTPIRAGIAAATLFKSAECRAKFASPDQLPDSIKGMIPPTEVLTEQKNMLLMMISEADKALVQLLASHGTGKVTIFSLAPTSYVKLTLGLPGLSKFLS